jgi:hypothetical protein
MRKAQFDKDADSVADTGVEETNTGNQIACTIDPVTWVTLSVSPSDRRRHQRTARTGGIMCPHTPACPGADAPDREAAHTIATHPEQGWSLLCNGIVLFDDTGELLPNGQVIAPHRPTDVHPEAFGLIAS